MTKPSKLRFVDRGIVQPAPQTPREWARNARTLVVIADACDATAGFTYIRTAKIAERAELEFSDVGRALHHLDSAGLIYRFPRYRKDGERTSDLILLGLGRSAEEVAEAAARLIPAIAGLQTDTTESVGREAVAA